LELSVNKYIAGQFDCALTSLQVEEYGNTKNHIVYINRGHVQKQEHDWAI